MNLVLNNKLVDFKTKKVIGLLYRDYDVDDFARYLPFSLEKAKELKLQDSDIAEFMDVEEIEVVTRGNKYALLSNSIGFVDLLEEVPYELTDTNVVIWGYLFEKYSIVDFYDSLEDAEYNEYTM